MGHKEKGAGWDHSEVQALVLTSLIIVPAAKFTEVWPLGSGSLNK